MLPLRAFGAWLLILACAILNGALREAVLLPAFGKPAALAISGLLLSALTLAVALSAIRWVGVTRASQSLAVGSFWLLLTLAFEFGFGLLVQRHTWQEMLEAYTFKDGNLWPLVLAVVLLAPLLAYKLRKPGKKVK